MPVAFPVVGGRGVWDCSIADLHCRFGCSFVYAAVEAIIIESTFIKAASIIDSFCKQGIWMDWWLAWVWTDIIYCRHALPSVFVQIFLVRSCLVSSLGNIAGIITYS